MAIYDLFLSRNGSTASLVNYIGHAGRLFYDSASGGLRISDGTTAGGLPMPLTVATTSIVGGIKPAAGFTVSPDGTLSLNAGNMFELTEANVFTLKAATETQIGGVKLGPGVTTNESGQIIIDPEGLEFSFGDFTSVVGTYAVGHPKAGDPYALLGSVESDEDIIIATNGTGVVKVIGEFSIRHTNGDIDDVLAEEPSFRITSDGQVRILAPAIDLTAGAVEIIANESGTFVAPDQSGLVLHTTGQQDAVARNYFDGANNYSLLVGRRYNGTAADITPVLNGQIMLRIAGQASTDTGFELFGPAQIDWVATENQTPTNQGGEIRIRATPNGSSAFTGITQVASFNATTGVTSTIGFVGDLTGNADTVTNGVYTSDTGTVTNTMLAGSIANNKLANSTISGIALGSNLATLTISTFLTGTSYNGSTAATIAVDATTTATANKVVARDASGNFAAGTITANLTGTASTATNLAAATSILAGTLNVNPPAIGKNGSATATYTITGLTTSHKVVVMPQAALPDEFNITASWASAANTLSIQYQTYGGGVDAAAFNIAYWAWV